MMLMFFITRSLSLSLALSRRCPSCRPPYNPGARRPSPKRYCFHRQCPRRPFVERPGTRKQATHNSLSSLAGTEVHAVHVSGHLLKEVLCGFDLRNRGLQGKVKEVTRGVGHNLFAKALQLLAVDKGERSQVRIDAAAAGVNIRQGHADQLDRFHLRSGIQRTARGITRRRPCQTCGWLVLTQTRAY